MKGTKRKKGVFLKGKIDVLLHYKDVINLLVEIFNDAKVY